MHIPTGAAQRRALIVVDVQVDFTEGGALACAGGAKAAADISAHIAANSDRYALIVASRDWHAPYLADGHFAQDGAQPNYATSWPRHCVAGTAGAQYHPNLKLPATAKHLHKGMATASYSAFQGEVGLLPLAEVLAEHAITDVEIVGIATEHCVQATAMDARAHARTSVLTWLCVPADAQAGQRALRDLQAAGVSVQTAHELAPAPVGARAW